MADLVIDDVIEEEEIIENPVIEDEFDSSFEEQDNREILENSYKKYENNFTQLTDLLKEILASGEYTEENKQQASEINDSYDESYIELLSEIDTAKERIEENKALDLNSNVLLNNQSEVFNALTKNGEVQGIYKDENGDIYINAEFLQTRGMKCVTDDDKTTLHIDKDGNITLNVKSFSLESKPLDNIISEANSLNIVNVDVMYYLSTSKTELTGGTWNTIAPEWEQNKYMWSKTVTTFANKTQKESKPTCIAGATGATGEKGTDGVSVTKISEQYGTSTSKKTIPTSWQDTFPTWSKGIYIWTRSKITYSNGTVSYTDAYCDTSWEGVMEEVNNKVDNDQKSVFNALTNNGETQGIYLQNGKVYINGEYIQAKGLSVTNDSGTQTFSIDKSGNVSAGNLTITEGTINIGTTTTGEVAFSVKTNGNLKIGGTTGRLNGDGTEQGIFEVTSKGTAHFRNKDDANIYSRLDDGKIQVRNGDILFSVDADGIQIKNMSTNNALKMSNNGISTDILTVSGRIVVGEGLYSNGFVRASSLAVANKKFSTDVDTINGDTQSVLFLGSTMIIYGRTSFTDITANTTATSAITFRQEFAYAPVVMTIPNSSSPQQCRMGTGNITTTGCNVYLNRTSSTNTNAFWVAIGERAGSDSFAS